MSVPAPAPISAPVISARRADGFLIPAPGRVDMVHDAKRNLFYITAGNSVLRYDLASKAFLTPLVLSGSLRGIDISADYNLLAIADATEKDGRIWIHLVDLTTGTNSRAGFPARNGETGTFSVAFGADGGVWISSSHNNYGMVPLRKYRPGSQAGTEIADVYGSTMLAASANRQIIAFAQSGMTPGLYGRFDCRTTQLPEPLRVPFSVYEIGINREGAQLAVPGYNEVAVFGLATNLPLRETLGVVYHPARDLLFVVQSGSSVVSVFETTAFTRIKQFEFGKPFEWTGNRAFQQGRLRISSDGKLLFCTAEGGVRCVETEL